MAVGHARNGSHGAASMTSRQRRSTAALLADLCEDLLERLRPGGGRHVLDPHGPVQPTPTTARMNDGTSKSLIPQTHRLSKVS